MRNRSCVYDALNDSHFICLKLQQFFYDRHLKAIKFKVEHLCCYWTLVNLYAQRNIERTFPVIAWLSPLSLCKAIFYALMCAKCKKKSNLVLWTTQLYSFYKQNKRRIRAPMGFWFHLNAQMIDDSFCGFWVFRKLETVP